MRAAVFHTVHPSAVVQLRRTLDGLGVDGEALFRRAGLAVGGSGERAPRTALLAAKALAARELGDPCLGYRMGLAMGIEDFGPLGAAMHHAPSLREALRIGVEYVATWEEGTQVDVTPSGPGRVCVRYQSLTPSSKLATVVDGQQTIVFLLGMARRLLGPAPHLIAGFACEPPRHPACVPPPWAECRFRTAAWYLDLPDAAAEGGHRRPGDHPQLIATLERALAHEAARLPRPGDLVSRLHAHLRENLTGTVRIGDVAGRLGVSPRVLQQRLREMGTSFSDELRAARVDVALALLREPGASVKEVAHLTGFADVAPFSRFVRRHTGSPPSAHRAPSARRA